MAVAGHRALTAKKYMAYLNDESKFSMYGRWKSNMKEKELPQSVLGFHTYLTEPLLSGYTVTIPTSPSSLLIDLTFKD